MNISIGRRNLHLIPFRDFSIAVRDSVRFARSFRYHNAHMVNYDTHNGFSVSSIYLQTEDHFTSGAHAAAAISSHMHADKKAINQNNTLSKAATAATKSRKSFLTTPSISILTIKEVGSMHHGNYTCAPSNAKQASITVHVLRGNLPSINNAIVLPFRILRRTISSFPFSVRCIHLFVFVLTSISLSLLPIFLVIGSHLAFDSRWAPLLRRTTCRNATRKSICHRRRRYQIEFISKRSAHKVTAYLHCFLFVMPIKIYF